MSNIFSKFFVSFGLGKKNKYLPAPEYAMQNMVEPFMTNKGDVVYSAKPYKTIATFDIEMQKPQYIGGVPDATIKFYPLDK